MNTPHLPAPNQRRPWRFSRFIHASLALVVSGCCSHSPTPTPTPTPIPLPTPSPSPITLNVDRELMIRDLRVVDSTRATSPDGPWHVRSLFRALSGADDPSAFALAWLRTWETNQTINGFDVPARPGMASKVIEPWKAASGQPGAPDDQVRLRWDLAPFRLLAIVNRMDLARVTSTAEVEDAGEGRFVFGLIDRTSPDPDASRPEFTVIFEYRLPAGSPAELLAWADRWHALGRLEGFGEDYLAELENVTGAFALDVPGGVVLNQIRTDEIHLASPWELREFHVVGRPARLLPITVARTPDLSHDGTSIFADWLAENREAILATNHVVPERFRGQPFLAGSALNPIPKVVWNVSQADPTVRHLAGLATCNGCHGADGGLDEFEFTHVKPRARGEIAALSRFLTGVRFPDPAQPRIERSHDDLLVRSNALLRVLRLSQPIPDSRRSVSDVRLFSLRADTAAEWKQLAEFFRSRRAQQH